MGSKFLIYWSLTFAILWIWIFSVAVALADVKDELWEKIQKQWAVRAKARMRPVDPLAGRSPAETITPLALDEKESWVLHLVSQIAISLKLNVRILVLQDSMGHYLVHIAQGKRLTSYRVDKAWVQDAMAGKADQRERIFTAVEQYLRQEFLGQALPPKAPAPAAPKPAVAAPAKLAGAPGAPAAAPGQPAGPVQPAQGAQPGQAAPSSQPVPGGEMSREEKIAAAKAKGEAIKAQREAAESGGTQGGSVQGGGGTSGGGGPQGGAPPSQPS